MCIIKVDINDKTIFIHATELIEFQQNQYVNNGTV